MILTNDSAERKATPIATGVMDYFPLALADIATRFENQEGHAINVWAGLASGKYRNVAIQAILLLEAKLGGIARAESPFIFDAAPRALAYVARVSKAGNDKHNPGQPLHWAKEKSTDHADCIARHLIDRETVDPEDGLLHAGKLAWRALALLETQLERETA